MPLLPVLDLKQSQVVRGVAGRRWEYRPIVSRLTACADPLTVARALHAHFGCVEFYLADLDAIAGAPPGHTTYALLHAQRYRLWVDAGVRKLRDALDLAAAGVGRVVVGLETIGAPDELGSICRALGRDRVVFSLDLRDGVPLGDLGPWATRDALQIARRAIAEGVARLLVLDLARVGTGAGTGTEALCRALRGEHAGLELAAGGGVRSADEVRRLYACGVDRVLVASALHDGRITPHEMC